MAGPRAGLAPLREVGPASTPSIAPSPTTLDVGELWRRTAPGEVRTRSRRASSIATAALFPSDARPRRVERAPSLTTVGVSLLVGSALVGTVGVYIVGLSSSLPPTGHRWLDAVSEDTHYKYLAPLQVTFLLAFVIVNWGSLKIFRHS